MVRIKHNIQRFFNQLSFYGLFLSMVGRITRGQYWFGLLIILIIAAISFGIMTIGLYSKAYVSLEYFHNIVFAAVLFCAYSTIALKVKRLHDIGMSAYHILLIFLPGIGLLILTAICGLGAGEKGNNEYGKDPQY